MKQLNGYEFYDFFIAGALKLVRHEEVINSINVFPIADSDTGSNLAYTMKCILANASRHERVDDVLLDLSRAALEDAYGNSGAIFASYLFGMSKIAHSKATLSIVEFAEVAKGAVQYAYEALSLPVEGTILTVMKSWGQYLHDHATHHETFIPLLKEALYRANDALLETKDQLEVLHKNNVVDAGAYGFVLFLEGMLDALVKDTTHIIPTLMPRLHKAHEETPNVRFCTEFLIASEDLIQREVLVNNLKELGESISFTQHGEMAKIHIHTNSPSRVSNLLSEHGKILKSKVDDMIMQINLNHSHKKPIGIITDSIADFKLSEDDLKYVHVVPLQVIIDGNVYVDRLTLENQQLFEIMHRSKQAPTSAHPSEIVIERAMRHMLMHYEKVIGIFVSSELSGMFQQAKSVLRKMKSDTITIVDSKTNSAAQGLLVTDALRLIQEGLPYEVIVNRLMKALNSYKIFVEIPDLHYATLSGRIPKVVGTIASLLKVKAIISIDSDGKGIVTSHRQFDHILNRHQFERYAMVYTGNYDSIAPYIEELQQKIGYGPEFISEASNIVSGFVGKGAVGIGFIEK